MKKVITFSSIEIIVTTLSKKIIITISPFQRVIAFVASKRVISLSSIEIIVTTFSKKFIIAFSTF